VWLRQRAGAQNLVVLVGHDKLTETRPNALVVPLSDVRASTLIEPDVRLEDGTPVGMAMTPRVGEIAKDYLAERKGRLHADSLDALETALRAVLDL
jgi:mRNA-degrading endonuclease toxin of MazEF toxin-antitoxin module